MREKEINQTGIKSNDPEFDLSKTPLKTSNNNLSKEELDDDSKSKTQILETLKKLPLKDTQRNQPSLESINSPQKSMKNFSIMTKRPLDQGTF